jgi:hypothetical protein
MCPLRAYGGYPTLVCHLRLKDMQRLGPDGRKTLYMTALVASRSLGPQVVAITKNKSKSFPPSPPRIQRIMATNQRLIQAMVEWRASTIQGQKMAHRMEQLWTRKEVAMANHLRKTICMTLLPIQRTLPATRRPRNPSVCD